MKRKYRLKIKISEKDVRRVIRDYLRVKGWFVFYLLQGLGCYPGATDMISIKNGRVLFIEIKRPGRSKQSDRQKQFQKDIEEHGGEYILTDNLDDLIKIIG